MKVIMRKSFLRFKRGQTYDVPATTARRWVRRRLAVTEDGKQWRDISDEIYNHVADELAGIKLEAHPKPIEGAVNFVCVCKSGGEYGPEHVALLGKQLKRVMTVPYNFYCLTDIPMRHAITVPLVHSLPGWWSKLEIFYPFQHAIYFDLDTLVHAEPTYLLELYAKMEKGDFFMLRDSHPHVPANSSVMLFKGNFSPVLDEFLERPIDWMTDYSKSPRLGDQVFISDRIQYGILPDEAAVHGVHDADRAVPVQMYYAPKHKHWKISRSWADALEACKHG